ncbi:MAG: hypothetical protein US69_C0011G0016 [candidate division TM6 bacterium GW2011_GWF2_38_10]|nr:MAG: hypothetical protein US69_C0011G0016 [candidate division TM6 bacterium GW2011_GWF2_38_10]
MLSQSVLYDLRKAALNLRIDVIRATTASKSGHPTSCFSAVEIMTVLFRYYLSFAVDRLHCCDNDRFILSKGHAVPLLYAAWKMRGVVTDEQLMSLRKVDSVFEGHPTPRFPYNEAATGSLGQGLAIGLGMSLASRIDSDRFITYVLLGDGELAEGSVWEAAALAAYHQAPRLVAIVDVNRLGQSGATMYEHDVEQYEKKFSAFGWETFVIDGHSFEEIVDVFEIIKDRQYDKPNFRIAIIAKTIKGYGLREFADNPKWHGKPFTEEEAAVVIKKLEDDNRAVAPQFFGPETQCLQDRMKSLNRKGIDHYDPVIPFTGVDLQKDENQALFERGKKMSTRKAFGYALVALGKTNEKIVVLDADVQNSTFTEFFAQKYPTRFVQCFIAEQSMIGIATGIEHRGLIPVAATFGAFFARAYDQIRMAGIGRNALRLCGSHCGVSIGQDGPSQMALEDIALMAAIPQSIILYPSDAVSAYYLTQLSGSYFGGISYLRTTRADTPILYDQNQTFTVGGSHILRQSNHDVACVVAAGITVHEALKAYELLKQEGISIAVIDAYSIKPLDTKTIMDVGQLCGGNIVTIEDHYEYGGLGSMVAMTATQHACRVTMLCVKELSRSGSPEALMKLAGIDADTLVQTIKKLHKMS